VVPPEGVHELGELVVPCVLNVGKLGRDLLGVLLAGVERGAVFLRRFF